MSTVGSPPTIPTEIWLQILRLATEDRDSVLEPLQLGPSDRNHEWGEGVEYAKSLDTKLSLVATCRQWNEIATPLLYEHISVRTAAQYTQVSKAFGGDGHSAKHSNLVARLDLVCRVEGTAHTMAIELCNLFPELTTLVASLAFSGDDEPLPLLNALSPRLKHFYLTRATNSIWAPKDLPLSQMVSFFNTHPQLEGLSTPYKFSERESSELHQDGTHWPSIRTLVFQGSEQAKVMGAYLPPAAFPNLQTVNGWWTPEGLGKILSTHAGQGLVTVGSPVDRWGIREFSALLRQLEATHPQVHEVHAWLSENCHAHEFSLLSAKAPQVTTVGVYLPFRTRGYHPNVNITEMHVLVAYPWTKAFPNLRTIRLMERVKLESYRALDDVTRRGLCSPGRYVRHPVRVEDRDGRFLAEFTAGISVLVEL